MSSTTTGLRELLRQNLPVLGGGATGQRWLKMYGWARTGPVSVARLAEAHFDALAILAEAGMRPEADAKYGVWASAGSSSKVTFDSQSRTVGGSKPFCSGLGVVDRALVTAIDVEDNAWLLDVDVADLKTPKQWATPALLDTATGLAEMSRRSAVVIGEPGFYLSRPGFWHAAVGPAACWAGAASGIVDYAVQGLAEDPYKRAGQGALLAQQRLLEMLLQQSGDKLDSGAMSSADAQVEAHMVRHLVERSCAEIVDRFSQAYGPRPFVSDASLAQRFSDVHLYCRQQHGEADLASLARAGLEER